MKNRMVSVVLAFYVTSLLLAPNPVLAQDTEFLSLLGGEEAKPEVAQKEIFVTPVEQILKKRIGRMSAEQRIFAQFFASGKFEQALFQWGSAFDGTAFAKSPSGRALNGLVLFANKIEVYGLETLLSVTEPARVDKEIKELWAAAAPANHQVWSLVSPVAWHPAWASVFGPVVEVRVRARGVSGADQISVVKDLLVRAAKGSAERAWLEWQLLLAKATGSSARDSTEAAQTLAGLMKNPATTVSQDLMTLTAARLLYQNGFLDAAIKYYEKVPKTSEDWFDAQEEMAWAHIRKGEPQDAIAITKTLAQPMFTAQVGPESIFLRSLALLKVCDYPEVSETLNLFRERYKERAKALLAIVSNPETDAVREFLTRAKTKRVKLTDLEKGANTLPRFLTRDESANHLAQTYGALEKEAAKFGELYARSLSEGSGKVGFQAQFEVMKMGLGSRVEATRSGVLSRVKMLAEEDLIEIGQILQTLHIVEAEVLQQVTLAGRVGEATSKTKISEKKGSTGYKGADRIWFPEENETWFDELAHYKVDLKKGCQASKQ